MAKSARDDGAGPMRLSPMERKAVEALRALKAQAGFDEERDYAGLGLASARGCGFMTHAS